MLRYQAKPLDYFRDRQVCSGCISSDGLSITEYMTRIHNTKSVSEDEVLIAKRIVIVG